jgi:thiol-disulfide isomerase/thioredoxin
MKRNWLLFTVIAIVFAAIGAYFGVQYHAPVASHPSVTARLFAQALPDAQGQSHPMSQWQGKTLIVNFWATWCAPCVEEMPELSVLQNEIAAKNGQIIGIGIDSAVNILEFTAKYKIAYPLYVAGMSGTELSRAFGNQAGGLPFTVLIAPDGKIKKTYLGRLKLEELRKDLASI